MTKHQYQSKNNQINFNSNKLHDKMVALACGEADSEDIYIPWNIIYANYSVKIDSNGTECFVNKKV